MPAPSPHPETASSTGTETGAGTVSEGPLLHSYVEVIRRLNSLGDAALRARLFGYLHHQMIKHHLTVHAKSAFDHALDSVADIPDGGARIDELRYLSTVTCRATELANIRDRIAGLGEEASMIRGYTSLAGQADKCGHRNLALDLLDSARGLIPHITDPMERTNARLNIGRGLHLCHRTDDAGEILAEARDDMEGMDPDMMIRAATRMTAALRRLDYPGDHPLMLSVLRMQEGSEVGSPAQHGYPDADEPVTPTPPSAPTSGAPSISPPSAPPASSPPTPIPPLTPTPSLTPHPPSSPRSRPAPSHTEASPPPYHPSTDLAPSPARSEPDRHIAEETPDRPQAPGNHVLALYDAYEGRMKVGHFRAIARAAPLCVAYDLDLALIGFPSEDPEAMVAGAVSETTVGRGGKLIETLHSAGRIHCVPASMADSPSRWGDLGTPVATTSRPDPEKSCTLGRNGLIPRGRTGSAPPDGRLCVVMGLGKKGLPPSLLARFHHHIELTGKNVPLETATAMGIIAVLLGSVGPGPDDEGTNEQMGSGV